MSDHASSAAPIEHDARMVVDIWSDVVCPWCAIGKANLDAALARFDHREDVDIVWHSYELDPNAPVARSGDYVGMLSRKYGTTPEQAQVMIDQMTERGHEAGVPFRFDIVQPGNTFDAHRLIHLGAARGIQTAVKERMLRGYLCEGEAIGLPEVLERLAVDAGLDADEVAAVLTTDAFAEQVRVDEATAASLQVTGVPFFVVDRRYAVPGAQPPELLLQVLEQAWAERSEVARDTAPGPEAEGGACSIDGEC